MKQVSVWKGRLLAFVAAVLVGSVLGSLVQTQINLSALTGLGITITPGQRLAALGHDLLNFAPIYAGLLTPILVVSLGVTATLLRSLQWPWPSAWYALGAALGLWAGLSLVNEMAPMPTLIAASREWPGLLAMMATSGMAGWVFALIARAPGGATPDHNAGRASVVAGFLLVASLSMVPDIAEAEPRADRDTAEATPYRIETVVDGLAYPWSLAFLPGGELLITERGGTLKRWHTERGLVPVSGVPPVYASGQAGLFDVLLAPDFVESGTLFLAYACGTGDANHLCVSSAVLAGNALINPQEVFRAQPAKSGNAHYGGRLAWYGDGSLIISLGDGFDYREQAQRLDSHLGKIVRIWPDGSIPDDNPFLGRDHALPEIFSLGHRNVQGLLYDRETGRLLAHEHGPRGGDEINHIRPGQNYGWPIATHGKDYTGALVSPFSQVEGTEAPMIHWTPSIAPSGFALYRGHQFPEWQGHMFVGALADQSVHRVAFEDGHASVRERLLSRHGERIRDVRSGPDGALYLLTDGDPGQVIRLLPGNETGLPGISLSPAQLNWIGDRIFQNECAGQHDCLVHWNDGEAFPSLGIGHFIWYPEGTDGRFTESFPSLIESVRSNRVPLPPLLAELWQKDSGTLAGAPWPDQMAFRNNTASEEVETLRQFLYQTRGLQVRYILDRARASMNDVIAAAPPSQASRIRERLWQLSRTPGGVYALMDYVNFKGEGLSETERYKGEGWGLLQVLLAMDHSPGLTALEQFRHAAGRVLTRRAQLAEADIERDQWLPGWLRRLDTYREPEPLADR
jgi:glucose/arabinose dehydrogenase